jgi:hypothetical protein
MEQIQMDQAQLIRDFESGANPDVPLHHADHVRLAYEYLCAYPVLQAIEKFSCALKRFAAARGKTRLYNETVTCAYFFLIRERMMRRESASWEEFARQNPDLLARRDGILARYYAEGTLNSELARRVFVLPDKCLSGV